MSTTILDDIRSEIQPFGGAAWIYQLLIQANETDETLTRAHVVIAKKMTPISPSEIAATAPLSVIEGDPLWEQVQGEINTTSVQQVIDLQQQIVDLQQQVAAQISQNMELQQLVGELQTQLSA